MTRTQIEKLTLFVKKSTQLSERECFEFLTSYKSSFNLEWKQGNPLKITNLVKPEIEEYRSYLLAFRPFVSNNEDIFVSKIMKTCISRARHINLRKHLIEFQVDWNKSSNIISAMTKEDAQGNKELFTGEELFLKWLNGTMFHIDLEAEKFFESLGILNDTFEVEVTKYIGWCSNFIMQLSNVINNGLNNNEFEFENEHSPHNKPKIKIPIIDSKKKLIIDFFSATKNFTQTFSICEEHDQDSIIAVENYEEGKNDLRITKVEIHGCCKNAVDKALIRIEESLKWIEYLKNNLTQGNSKAIELIEIEITDDNDIQIIKIALENYNQKWRKAIGKLRCSDHRMPPGVYAFGKDTYQQHIQTSDSSSVYLQGCCEPFIKQVMQKLRNYK